MNYNKIYHNIISNRLQNPVSSEYTECHHILPKSLGGTDDKSNLVNLLAREHFICHLLLTKMYKEGSVEWIKMIKAFMRMFSESEFQKRYSNNKWYEYLKINYSIAQSLNQSGKGNSQYGKCWISNLKTKECKSIKLEKLQEYLDNGWIKKRICNWNKYEKEVLKKELLQKKRNSLKKKFNEYYKIYCEYGFQQFVQITNYDKTLENLIDSFKRYVDNYEKHQGKQKFKKLGV